MESREEKLRKGRIYREKNKEKIRIRQKEWRKKNWRSQREKEKNTIQYKTRRLFTTQVQLGKIKRGNCIICDKPNAHGHHEDYSKPFEVIWLCQTHHNQYHKGDLKLPT